MEKVAVVVEGKGDVKAGTSLLAKVASHFGLAKCASDPPIRAGEALKLRREGELERYLTLAASRADASSVLLLLDLDDDCPANFAREFNTRAQAISSRFCKRIEICFAIREFEGWLLGSLASVRTGCPEYGIELDAVFENAESIRAAKEALSAVCKVKGYKPMRDQEIFAKKIDIIELMRRSRSFRRFVKAVTGLSYATLESFRPSDVTN